MNDFKRKEEELIELREHKLKGALIRARWQQITEGEKPSKYFLNLENRNFVSKHIREIKKGTININNPKEILEEMKIFYESLYKNQQTDSLEESNYKHLADKMPKLNETDRLNIEKEISLEELKTTVYKSKNNKSPGPDGFSNEFYKKIWTQIKQLLLKLMLFYRERGSLNKNQISGIITCIPKGGKLRNDLKNWRPITLLNSIYKFYSGILAERIKNLLPKLIHPDQKGFINDRFIGENTRLIYDIINECEKKKLSGIIILIDFEIAFDSISWKFILKSLEKFNFGEDIKKWVKSLQLNSNSKILQNGHLSDEITLGRGCRQGDPISPYLFILAAEFLAEAIRTNKNIKGIKIHETEHKLSLYADDTTIFLKHDEQSIRSCIGTLKEFKRLSGLKINEDKTKVIKIGVERDNRIQLCTDLNLIWTNKFTALGITYDIHNMKQIADQNIEIKMNEILKLIRAWSGRNITPLGKITLIKSLLISKITHILLSLPTPNDNTIEKLENVFKNFIWQQKPPKFRRVIMETTVDLGGLKMINLRIFDNALKISWIKRLKNQDDWWEKFPRHFNIHNIITFGDKYPTTLIKKIDNDFWKDVARSCALLQNKLNSMQNDAYNIPIWFNSGLQVNFKKTWYDKGYTKISDILDENGQLLSRNVMNEIGLSVNFLDYEKIRFDITNINMKAYNKRMYGPYIPPLLFAIGYNTKGCARTYNLLMNYNNAIVTDIQANWEEILREEVPYQIIRKSFTDLHKLKEGTFSKYLQFKLLHRRIITNKSLKNMGLSETSKCPYCNEEEETIEHAFLFCDSVKKLWYDVQQWLRRYIDGGITIPNRDKIMGIGHPASIVEKTIMATKRVIYRNRQEGAQYSLRDVTRLLKSQMTVEEYHSGINGNDEEFLQTWEIIYEIIR